MIKLIRPRRRRGVTVVEVLIALFIFMVGIVGVLAALPTGITSAQWVIFQDAAIHLAHSKFAEFRRDRIDPAVLIDGSAYMNAHGPLNASGWYDFKSSGPTDTYTDFDDIERYEWRVTTSDVKLSSGGTPPPPAGYFGPGTAGGNLNCKVVTIYVRCKGTSREFRFTQYMTAYEG
jgi:hypothetical protein